MKSLKLFAWSLAGGLMVLAPGVGAVDLKIGVINALKVLDAAPQAELARKKLEDEFKPRDQRLAAAQKALKQKEDRYTQEGQKMSESERKRLEKEILDGRRDLKRDMDEFREDFNFRRNDEFKKIQQQVVEAIKSIAKEDGYDLIIGEGAVYANEKVDITAKVIDRIKKGR